MLKTLKFLFAFALILSLTACGDDEDDTMNSTDLVGVWDAQSFDVLNTSTTVVSGMSFTTITEVEGIDIDYELTLNESDFTTVGEYSYNANVISDGTPVFNEVLSVTDVTGVGTYTTLDDIITTNGALFELEFDGQDLSALQGEANANFSINGNTLTFTQDEEMITETQGVTTTSVIQSTSTWTRQ